MFKCKFTDIYGGTIYQACDGNGNKLLNAKNKNQHSLSIKIESHFKYIEHLIDEFCLEINENFNSSQILVDKSILATTDIQFTTKEAC